MSRFFSSKYAGLVPYVPGEQPRSQEFIKLNTNESPFPPSSRAIRAAAEAARRLNLYSDPECRALNAKLAEVYHLAPEEILCTNGSDEILNFAFMAFCDAEHSAAFPNVTYGFYKVFAALNGVPYEEVPLREDFSANVNDYVGLNKTIFIANPNAPTGVALPLKEVEAIIAANPDHVVVIDEAYVDFGGVSADTLLKEYDNLVVVRTLSKSRALAGLRVGYALGSPNLIAGLCCVRDSINSYTVDRLAQAGAVAALEDGPYFEEMRERVIRTRERTEERLRAMGFAVLESKANFLFVSHPKRTGKALLDGLREQGILVRWFDRPRIGNYLRISVGTDDEMDALCAALKALTEG